MYVAKGENRVMNFITMLHCESLHSIVLDIRTMHLDRRSLLHILTESCDGMRTFYSIVSALYPTSDPCEEVCIVHDVTGDREQARRIFRLLAEGEVTPCTLEDILSDML